MSEHEASRASTTEGLPVSPSLGPALEQAEVPPHSTLVDRRVVFICVLSALLGLASGLVAQALMALIGLITNLAFYGRIGWELVSPGDAVANLGLWVIPIPVVGALIIGVMARYGSKAIRGHGIPEAMEQVLSNKSRIPARITLLKPLSAAIAIGTGGPFGAEGPIIATGGALGSLVGQLQRVAADERKVLLAAGAAGGMAATFGSPVAAVLLAIELLLFEFRPRSFIPVAFASVTATAVRIAFEGMEPIFELPTVAVPSGGALAVYVLIGALIGVVAVGVTRAIYAVEDGFNRLPIHWMWWPALGAIVVGVVGYFAPRTLGVGYDTISDVLSGHLTVQAILFLGLMKFISWSIYLGSGTSGGTLAPLFIIGSSLGAVLGVWVNWLVPGLEVSPSVAALVGMAAIFGGASRTLLASVVFAFETTLQPMGLLPLLGGCAASYLVACLLMRESIMTEKIARRGVRVPADYAADLLEMIRVSEVATAKVITLKAGQRLEEVIARFGKHAQNRSLPQGFPVVDEQDVLVGVVTWRDIADGDQPGERRVGDIIRRPPIICYDDTTLRDAVDHMVNHDVGRVPVVERSDPGKIVGIITRSDVLSAYRRRLEDARR
ncbi:MAG: chloride channel protein [Phycisphaeraceae bacterium]